MIRVFISQPMRGRTTDEILQERDAIKRWLKEGYEGELEILDSILHFRSWENPLNRLSQSLHVLSFADVAYFAKGWERARGCIIENQCAKYYGIRTIEESGPPEYCAGCKYEGQYEDDQYTDCACLKCNRNYNDKYEPVEV